MRELRGAGPSRPAPEDPGRLSPDQPVWDVHGGQRGAEEGHATRPERALVPETPRPAGTAVDDGAAAGSRPLAPGAVPAPTLRPAAPGAPALRRRLLAIVLAVGLFAAGVSVGAMVTRTSGEPARTATAVTTSRAPATTAAPTTTAPARQVTPPSCVSAVDDADAVISYLVSNVRDQRLARTLEQYRAASRACRRAS